MEWVESFSTTHKRTYWFNKATGKTSWEKPQPSSTDEPPQPPATSTATPAPVAEKGKPTNKPSSTTEALPLSPTPTSKRPRVEGAHASTVIGNQEVKNSYMPPVSGSAVDESHVKKVALKDPIIPFKLENPELDMWTRQDIQVNSYLAEVYKKGFIVDERGETQKFKDVTNPIQGRNLYNLTRSNGYSRTLEVGLAMGASAVWMTQALRENNVENSQHFAIDPNQTKQYENMGRTLVQRCGNEKYLTVLEMTSYRALPQLYEQVLAGKIPKFHLIYIDGWHTFDYTLIDFFYADLLLEVNGVIVLDDIKHTPVKKTLQYIKTNYPHIKVVAKTICYSETDPKSSQATFVKLRADEREWNYHRDF